MHHPKEAGMKESSERGARMSDTSGLLRWQQIGPVR
jgi:hypothetical protein